MRRLREDVPTIPKAPVKTKSKKLFPKVENGPTQPPKASATAELRHVASTSKKGAEVEFMYPQQLNY